MSAVAVAERRTRPGRRKGTVVHCDRPVESSTAGEQQHYLRGEVPCPRCAESARLYRTGERERRGRRPEAQIRSGLRQQTRMVGARLSVAKAEELERVAIELGASNAAVAEFLIEQSWALLHQLRRGVKYEYREFKVDGVTYRSKTPIEVPCLEVRP